MKSDPNKSIEMALAEYKCPYCGHLAKSSSGRTLHLKRPCKAIKPSVRAAGEFKRGVKVKYQLKEHKIVLIKDGLLVLSNGDVASATKVTKATGNNKAGSVKIKSEPRNAVEWVQRVVDRLEGYTPERARHWVLVLYKITGYAKYRKWTEDHIKEALDKIFA